MSLNWCGRAHTYNSEVPDCKCSQAKLSCATHLISENYYKAPFFSIVLAALYLNLADVFYLNVNLIIIENHIYLKLIEDNIMH